MAETITAAAPALVDADGGTLCVLTGPFVAGRAYRVYIGTDASGPACYSGVSGQGPLCFATANKLSVVIAECTTGDVPLYIVDTTNGTEIVGGGILQAQAPFLCAMTFALRRDIRALLDTGPTDPSELPDAMPVPGFAQ